MALDHAPAGEDRKGTPMSVASFYGLWSQEERMGLLLLIDRLVPMWKARYFGSELPPPFEMPRTVVYKSAPENQRANSLKPEAPGVRVARVVGKPSINW